MSAFLSGASFGDRYALETIEGGGVLVDLVSGAYFSLNATAARACAALSRCPNLAIATAALAREMSLSDDEAGRIVQAVTAGLGQDGNRADPIGPFRYRRTGDGYTLDHDGQASLRLDERGASLELLVAPSALTFPLLDYVRAVVPKILFLRNAVVVHGAACEIDGALTAFCGISHAGKTTTARAFGAAGAPVVAEDLLLLDSTSPDVAVYTGGERAAHAWAEHVTAELARGAETRVSCDDLASALSGPTLPISRIWFMDERRRRGTEFSTRRLGPAEGLLPLMSATFLGGDDAPSWRRYLHVNRGIAERVGMWEVWAPDGVGVLAKAAQTALERPTSRS